jgi:hypothetical protein
MVRLDCSGIRFGSQLDEKHLFVWAVEIPGVVGWDQDTLLVRSRAISAASLRDLLALFYRYNVPMQQLQIFLSSKNEHWFKQPIMYWHKRVFPGKFNSPMNRDAKARPLSKR